MMSASQLAQQAGFGTTLHNAGTRIYDIIAEYFSSAVLGSVALNLGFPALGVAFTNPGRDAENIMKAAAEQHGASAIMGKLLGVLSKVLYVLEIRSLFSFLGTQAIQWTSRGGPFKVIIDAMLKLMEGAFWALSFVILPISSTQADRKAMVAGWMSHLSFLDDVKTLASVGFGMISYGTQFICLVSELSALVALSWPSVLVGGLTVTGFLTVLWIARETLPGMTDVFSILGQILCEHPEFGVFGLFALRMRMQSQFANVLFGIPKDPKDLNELVQRMHDGAREIDAVSPVLRVATGGDEGVAKLLMTVVETYTMDRIGKRDFLLKAALNNIAFIPTETQMNLAVEMMEKT